MPLSLNEWALVLLFAAPVLLIDELLKLLGRRLFGIQRHVPHKRPSQLVAEAAAGKVKAA